jgi:hypothetical protein
MKTVHVVLGADLRGNHNVLEVQAKKHNLHLSRLRFGEAVLFINRKKDKLKSYSFNGVVSYIRFDDSGFDGSGRRGSRRGLDLDALNEIPRAFSPNGVLDYDKALKITLEKKLGLSKTFKETEVLKSKTSRSVRRLVDENAVGPRADQLQYVLIC